MARCGCGGGACTCSIEVGDGLSLSGSGSIANPFLINLDDIDCAQVRPCISAGDGLTYNSGTGVMALRPSGDAGNIIEIGGDGGAYATVDCSDVRPCLSGGDGIAYDPVTGVIRTRLSTDPGNNAVFGGDGGVYVPAGGATVITGCGLDGDGSAGDPLLIPTATWDYPCTIDDHAGRVFCDTTGALRSEPRPVATFVQQSQDTTYPDTLVPAGIDVLVENRVFVINNPDPCREAFVVVEAELDVDLTLPVNAAAAYAISTDDMVRYQNRGTATQNDVHWQGTKVYNRTIPPGGVLNEPFEIRMGMGTNGATYDRIQTFHRAFIFNL